MSLRASASFPSSCSGAMLEGADDMPSVVADLRSRYRLRKTGTRGLARQAWASWEVPQFSAALGDP
jgi:hypothetical protein